MRVIEMQELIKLLEAPGDIPSTQVSCTDRLLRFIYPNKDDTLIAAMMEKRWWYLQEQTSTSTLRLCFGKFELFCRRLD
jgi:hypothetical protein